MSGHSLLGRWSQEVGGGSRENWIEMEGKPIRSVYMAAEDTKVWVHRHFRAGYKMCSSLGWEGQKLRH